MFAIIKTGGKQYRVQANDVLRVEKLDGEPGAKVSFGEVLMMGGDGVTRIGAPFLKGAAVEGEIVSQLRDDKVRIFKKKRRKGHQRTKGHRQHLTAIKITDIRAA